MLTSTQPRCTAGFLSLVLLLCLLAVDTAAARCGGVTYAITSRPIDKAHRPPLAIGDSTMVRSAGPLARAGFEVSARPCRKWDEGLDLMAQMRRLKRLPKVVLVHLGINAGVTARQMRRGLRIIGPRRILVIVTPRPGPHARAIRAFGKRWPKRTRVFDWVRTHHGENRYFEGLSLHPNAKGVRLYVRMCKRALLLNRQTPR